MACCRLALTRLSFLAGPYIRNSAAMNATKSPVVRRFEEISWLPYQRAAARARPPMNSIIGGSADSTLVTFMVVRYKCWDARSNLPASRASAPKALTMRWPVKASALTWVICARAS